MESLEYYYSKMEINQIRLIGLLVADPNLSRVSERVGLTQSAISKKIKAMELELGLTLFERRGPRGMKPTPEGIEFSKMAESWLQSWDTGLNRLKSLEEIQRPLVLVGPELFLREILLPWWERKSKSFPNVILEVRVSELSHVAVDAIRADADIAFLEHREELGDFVCRPLYSEKWGIVKNPTQSFPTLNDFQWGSISLQSNPVDHYLVKPKLLKQPNYRIFWQDLTALALWVSETPGAASVLPWHAVAWLVKKNRLVFEALPQGGGQKKIHIAYRRKSHHREVIESMIQMFSNPW